jgi:hypothetical protein
MDVPAPHRTTPIRRQIQHRSRHSTHPSKPTRRTTIHRMVPPPPRKDPYRSLGIPPSRPRHYHGRNRSQSTVETSLCILETAQQKNTEDHTKRKNTLKNRSRRRNHRIPRHPPTARNTPHPSPPRIQTPRQRKTRMAPLGKKLHAPMEKRETSLIHHIPLLQHKYTNLTTQSKQHYTNNQSKQAKTSL